MWVRGGGGRDGGGSRDLLLLNISLNALNEEKEEGKENS
jgi:hypothetical protein